jgi:hypothetical protein
LVFQNSLLYLRHVRHRGYPSTWSQGCYGASSEKRGELERNGCLCIARARSVVGRVTRESEGGSEGERTGLWTLIPFSRVYRARQVNWRRSPLNTRNTVSIGNGSDHSSRSNPLLQRPGLLEFHRRYERECINDHSPRSINFTHNTSRTVEFRATPIRL